MEQDLLKLTKDDFEVSFSLTEIVPSTINASIPRPKYTQEQIDARIAVLNDKVAEFDREIDRLTNHADMFDYAVAVSSGILTGLIDIFFVGEIDWEKELGKSKKASKNANKWVNKFIEKIAELEGYDFKKGENGKKRLEGAIAFLERKHKLASDNIWKGEAGKSISSTCAHHLDDLAHHPTLIGLVANIFTTLFRVGIFVNKDGEWHFALVETDFVELLKLWGPIILTAVATWLVNILDRKYHEEELKEIPKPIRKLLNVLAKAPAAIELLLVTKNWLGHLVSDMGGSKNTAGKGMGIPGIFLSLLKEISSLPGLNNTELPAIIDQWYRKDKIDLRKELAFVSVALEKQSMPIIINEVLVRGFYFVRRLIQQAQLHGKNWKEYNWREVIPFNNRTIVRMLTIAHGTFVAMDVADAAIRAAMSGKAVDPATFLAQMALRVNFVGLGRLTFACWSEVKMSFEKASYRKKRINANSELIQLLDAKCHYKLAEVWVEAYNAQESIIKLEMAAQKALEEIMQIKSEMDSDTNDIAAAANENDELKDFLLSNLQ